MRVLLAVLIFVFAALQGAEAQDTIRQDRGWLGVELRDLTKAEATALGWDEPRGAFVVKPVAGGPGAKAGLVAGDVVVSLDGQEVENTAGFDAAVGAKAPGAEVRLRLLREKRERRLTVALAAAPVVQATAPEPSPLQLMLDPGGHMSVIRGLAWTPDGRQIVSAGEDKVIRIWDTATGKTVRTIRGEVGPGPNGNIFALALSADGQWLAVGGWMDRSDAREPCCGDIRVYDFKSKGGDILAVLKGHTSVVGGLAFAPDGRRLISGSSDASAIIWAAAPDAAGGWRAGRLQHRLKGHVGTVKAVGFSPDGTRAVTGAEDTTPRLWSVASGGPVGETMTGHKDKIRALAINPRDGSIVSGSWDGEIRVWDGGTGRLTRTLRNAGGRIGILAFDRGGTMLLGSTGMVAQNDTVTTWRTDDWTPVANYIEHDNSVFAAAFSPDGRWAASGGGDQRQIHIWDVKTGERRRGPDGQPMSLGGSGGIVWAAGFSPDGHRIAWGNTWKRGAGSTGHSSEVGSPLEVQLRLTNGGESLGRPEWLGTPSPLSSRGQGGGEGRPQAPAPVKPGTALGAAPHPDPLPSRSARGEGEKVPPAQWLRARTTHGAWSLAHRRGGLDGFTYDGGILDIRQDGRTVASITRGPTDGYEHQAYSFTADGKVVLSAGGNGHLLAYGLDGRKLASFEGHDGDIWAVTPSPDGRYLISGAADQTLCLWSLAGLGDPDVLAPVNGKAIPPPKIRPIVTLFHGRDGEWVMWTPEGYYTASARGAELIGWQINRGADKLPDYITAGQLREQFNRPDIVDKAILLASSTEAVRTSNGTIFKLEDLIKRPAPRLAILSPASNSTEHGGRTAVKIRLDAVPDAVKAIRIHVNGALVDEKEPPIGAGGFPAGEHVYQVPLARGKNQIVISALNDVGWSDPKQGGTLTLTHDGDGDLDRRGVLYLVAIGVNDYKQVPKSLCTNGICDLALPSTDAKKFAETMEKRLGSAHTRVERRLLINGAGGTAAPTAANILDALDLLKAAKETDTVVLFIAGHGINEGATYRFLPTDAAVTSTGFLTRTTVPWHAIQEAVETAKGRRIMFIDTCHSGNAYNQKLDGAAYHANIIAYTAARWDQEAIEDVKLGNGLFTYAVVEGLEGKAAASAGDRAITTARLADYIAKRVSGLAAALKGEQDPQYFKGRDAEDYVLVK